MNGKQAKRIRKLLNLSKEEMEGGSKELAAIRRIGIINGETGELSEREEERFTNLSSPIKGIYRTLKKAFKNKEDELHEELTNDLKGQKQP